MKYPILIALCCLCYSTNCLFAQNETVQEAILLQHHKEIGATRDFINKRIANCVDSLKMRLENQTRTRIYNEYIYLIHLPKVDEKKELQIDFDFIRNNPSSKLCLKLLSQGMLNKQYTDMYDTFYHYFTILPDEEKYSSRGKMLTQEFINWKNNLVGSYAKDFEAKDIDNNRVKLSSYKNKNYVLLDFWGVHCGPCRHAMPYLKELYSKYHGKGLEIIGISPDYDFDNWRQAIKQDGTDIWRQVSQRLNNADIFKEFYVQAMPVKILVDKDGKIIGRWYGDNKENNAALAQKLQEAFGM